MLRCCVNWNNVIMLLFYVNFDDNNFMMNLMTADNILFNQ